MTRLLSFEKAIVDNVNAHYIDILVPFFIPSFSFERLLHFQAGLDSSQTQDSLYLYLNH